MERTEERSHGGADGLQAAGRGEVSTASRATTASAPCSCDGRLDATLLYLTDNNLVDRSRITARGQSAFHLLFPSPAGRGAALLRRRRGIFPINHGMVVRRSIYEQHPWVALNIFNAFRLAKERVNARMRELASTHFELGLLGPEAQAGAAGRRRIPTGCKSNQKVLETVADYSLRAGPDAAAHAARGDLRGEHARSLDRGGGRVGGACGPPPPFAAPLRCALTSGATPRLIVRGRTALGGTPRSATADERAPRCECSHAEPRAAQRAADREVLPHGTPRTTKRGVAPEVSAQRSGATNGGGGPQAPPTRRYECSPTRMPSSCW